MLNGVNINYIIVLLVTGAVLLAAIYHSILFLYRRTPLLFSYSLYLWSGFAYCLFRSVYISSSSEFPYWNPDEVLQMVSFVLYIRFASVALELNPRREKAAWQFSRITPWLMLLYVAVNTYLVNVPEGHTMYVIAKIAIRCYLLFAGFFLLMAVMRKRSSHFYRFLAAGAISMIFCGLVSSSINLLAPSQFLVGALSWLMFGYFTDVVFFSAAIGFRIREEHKEREQSLKQLLEKEAELQQKELEKMKLAYETREEERMRIARDLHDDMGSTLSSISIYSDVVHSYLDKDREKAASYLQKIQANAKQLMETTTDLIWSLQTSYGTSESIFMRMHRTAMELLSSASITPHLYINSENMPPLTIIAQKACWLIFKEAINNVCKYSKATSCTIRIEAEHPNLTMTIADDGVGFLEHRQGNGLKNMIERSRSLQGNCLIESAPGKGTLVRTAIPLAVISSLHPSTTLHEEKTY
jgi:signal transduction histidine kinase